VSRPRDMRRRRILESAVHAFAKKDYAEVSMEEVATRAGVARGTLYNHFRSKEKLYKEVLALRIGELMDRLEGALREESDPVGSLRRCVVHPFLFFVKYPDVLLLWRREELKEIANGGNTQGSDPTDGGARRKAPLIRRIAGMRERLAGLLRGILCRGIGQGIFRSVDPDGASHVILGAIEGMAGAQSGAAVDSPSARKAKEELFEFVSASLSRPGSPQLNRSPGPAADDAVEELSLLGREGA